MVAVTRFTTRLFKIDQLAKKRYRTLMVAVTRFTTRLNQLTKKRCRTPYGSSDDVYHQIRPTGPNEVLYLYVSSDEVYHQTRPTDQKEVRYPPW